MLWIICIMCNLRYSILCFPASVLVFEAFAVLGVWGFMGPSNFTWIEQKLLQGCPCKKWMLRRMLSVIWGGNRGEGKRGDLGHLPWKWVIIYTRHVVVSLSSIFIAVKSGYMLLPNPNLPFISFVPVLNGYKQLPNLPGTQGLAPQCWWWGYQEARTHKSRGKVLSGYSISRQAVVVCKVKISGN